MKSILKALYSGDLNLSGANPFPDDFGYRKTAHSISDLKTRFKNKLSAEDGSALENLYNLQAEIVGYDTSESFRSGFCVGALVMMEVLTSKEAAACE